MPKGIYGSPVLRPQSNEVVGVMYGALNIAKTQVSQRLIPGKSEKAQYNNASTITLGLAHHTNNLRSLLGMIALTKPLSESTVRQKDSDRKFGGTIAGLESLSVAHAVPEDHISPKDHSDQYAGDERIASKQNKTSVFTLIANSFKNGGTGRTLVSGLARFLDIVTSLLIRFIRRIPFYVIQIWKLINKFIEYIRTREERAMAADIEKNLRIVEKYENQLGSESQKRLDKARDVFKDIKSDYPNNQN
jgi:hypothetical protein